MILEPDVKALPKNQQAIADENTWPSTETIFEPKKTTFDSHDWVQQGYFIIDNCANCPRQAVPIPSGKMLVKEGGKYAIVNEVR